MAIHRAARPETHFTQIRNDVLRDDRLSYRARGLLAVILSHADGWSTSSESLATAGREGRDAIRTALQELEDAGYLVREKRQDSQGRWATQQVIYDTPHAEVQPALFSAPTTGNQASVDQASVSQAPIEDQEEQPSPDGEGATAPKAEPPGTTVAKAVYDHAEGMVNFLAIRQIAARALKTKGATADNVTAAMVGLHDSGRPITFQTVGQALARRPDYRQTGETHWENGGQF